MINREKKGFSLAELLLCVAIIGIVSALGANIAKKSTEKAYRTYIKSGYQNLYDSLADVQYRRGNDIEMAGFTAQQRREQLAQDLRELFGTDSNGGNPNNAGTTAITRNGVRYTVQESNGNGGFIISMQVPQAKTRQNQNGLSEAINFLYNRRGNGYLIPLDGDLLTNNPANTETYNVLRFYIDTGVQGRVRYAAAGNNASFEQVNDVLSYQDVGCSTNGHLVISVPSQYVRGIIHNGNMVADAWAAPQSSWTFNGGTTYDVCPGAGAGNNRGVIRQYTGR